MLNSTPNSTEHSTDLLQVVSIGGSCYPASVRAKLLAEIYSIITMSETLNDLERAILNKIAVEYPFLQSHIPLIQVKSRENTGVGKFVNFFYLVDEKGYQLIPNDYFALSAKAHLHMEGLEHGLAYEIAISNGYIDFLELVTYYENWDGTVKHFWFDQ